MLRIAAETTLGAFSLDVELEVASGECLALAGPSGAGKSSVLRVIAGLVRPERGTVRCGERVWLDTARGVDLPPEARRCGYVFQDYALFPHLSAWQNVAYGLRGVPRRERRAHALALLERFGLAEQADARPRTLSGGERQRVAVARALAVEPDALLLDEPLSALDARTRAAAGRELAAVLHAAAVPALLVTHDFQEAALLGDRVGVIDGGRIVQVGSAGQLAAMPASPFVADFTGAIVLTGTAMPAADGLTRVRLDGGGEVTSPEPAAGPVAVTVYPWDIALAPRGSVDPGSARNHLDVEVLSVTAVGGRVRVGLAAPQPLTAELTEPAVRAMRVVPGQLAVATWKATATRLLPLSQDPSQS
ncbi:MAG TPA: ABC transporter ATP-binding protein [Solirubrobacteraceae bacterium]|jgi:molybdate transport system ATP-binding protein